MFKGVAVGADLWAAGSACAGTTALTKPDNTNTAASQKTNLRSIEAVITHGL
jgi:hypothetical protein